MKPIIAEFVGTASLLVVVVGSGIMGENLAQGNAAIALLANSFATAAGLYALISALAGISGAHFNPAVSLFAWLRKKLSLKDFAFYSFAQALGGIFGVWMTHVMFGLPVLQLSTRDRSEGRLILSEVFATAGLLAVIALVERKNPQAVPAAVASTIAAAYWATSSTSFANPAVTLARNLTDTFTGIHWGSMPGFIGAQFLGAVLALGVVRAITR